MFTQNLKAAYAAEAVDSDQGTLVEAVLIGAAFVIVCVFFVAVVVPALQNKTADLAGCIEGASVYNSSTTENNCKTQNHAAKAGESFKDSDAYKGRYGS